MRQKSVFAIATSFHSVIALNLAQEFIQIEVRLQLTFFTTYGVVV